MIKFTVNVRHRPLLRETIEERFNHFVAIMRVLPPPWGLADGKELKLPPMGTKLATDASLRGKLGKGLTGMVSYNYRVPANLSDFGSNDDFAVFEFDATKFDWRSFVTIAFPGYLRAIGAYIGHVYRWEEAPQEWDIVRALSKKTGNDYDGRDGFFRFGPASFMDHELCRRGCNGMTPEQIVTRLIGVVPEVKLFENGVLIVANEHFPSQEEIIATDRKIRESLNIFAE